MKPLALTLFFSAVLAAPAFAGVGPALDVPVTSPTIGRAAGGQRKPQVASDGRDFFAVWIDSRGGYGSVYGTRVLADGTVLDPTGILINPPEQFCDSAALAWDGSNYIVAWQGDSRVNFTRVDRDGMVLGPPQTVFANNGSAPSIASNGHGSIVIAHKLSIIGNALVPQNQAAVISANGTIARTTSLAQYSSNVQIASNGDGYLFSQADLTTSTTSFLRLDNNGNAVAGSGWQLPEAYTTLTAGTSGQYLMAGRKFSGGASCAHSIVGRLVTNSGLSDPFVIHDAGGADIQDIAVTADASGFQVVWMKRLGSIACPTAFGDPGPPPSPPFALEQIQIGQDGSSGTPVTLTEGNPSDEQPAIASNGAALVSVWIESDTTHNTARIAAAIAHPGEQAVPIPIALSAAAQSDSAVAAGDGVFMTAWSEERQSDGTRAIYARRFNTDGHPLDASAIKVSTNDHTRIFYPAVSFDGAVWLFIWVEDSKAVARRMALDGTWIDVVPITIASNSGLGGYAVASNGDGFAVLTLGKPALTFIPRAGGVHTVTVPFNLGFTEYLTYPSMAWDGSGYTAVWTHGNTNDVEGIRLDEDGQVITPRIDIAGTSRTEWTPSIACHEGSCAVAWYSNGAIGVARIIDGVVAPFSLIPAAGTGYAYQPKVLATRDGFQLLWIEWDGQTHALLMAPFTQSAIGASVSLGSIAITSAAMTARDQLALTFLRPDYGPASGGAQRAFLRVWPAAGRRRAAAQP